MFDCSFYGNIREKRFGIKSVFTTGGQVSKMYGLAKIHKHKSNPPYRSILSRTRSFKYKLAITLDKLLKPFIPQQYIVKDTFEFINRLKAFDTHSNIQYVSFDAKSVFTNIPIERTIQHICNIIPPEQLPFDNKTF